MKEKALISNLFTVRDQVCPLVVGDISCLLIIISVITCRIGLGFCVEQGSHWLEKYLNLEGFLEKSLKINYALKITGKSDKDLEKSLNSIFFVGINTVDRDLNQNKTVLPLFGAANAAPNECTTIFVLIF